MDIRTKLSLALVFFSLISMMLLGVFAYTTSATLLREISLRQLDALAEGKKRDLIKVYRGWEDKLRLVRNRDKLRTSMFDYMREQDEGSLREIRRIIEGITVSLSEFDKLTVLDKNGDEITSFGRSRMSRSGVPFGDDIGYVGTFVYEGVHEGVHEGTSILVALNTPVEVDGQVIGGLELIVDARDLNDITDDYTGLGETGESVLLMKKSEERLQVLSPLRHDPETLFPEVMIDESSEELLQLFVTEEVPAESHLDYRNKWVWSATRIIPVLDWGLVVKVDVAEERKRAAVLRKALFDISLALSAFAIVGGTLLGFFLARPIQQLAGVVERIRQGEEGVRAEVKGNDEVALMSEALNEFIQQVESEHKTDQRDA